MKQSKEFAWLRQSCNKAFNHITDLMSEYYEELQNLVSILIKTYENCI